MRIQNLRYSEYENAPKHWTLDELQLDNINLVVGKNASGKSRTLAIINSIARLVSGHQVEPFISGDIKIVFDEDGRPYEFQIHYENKQIIHEEIRRDGKILLTRGNGGAGKIFAEKENKDIEFQTPASRLAVVARQDDIQHSFLAPLVKWGASTFLYAFGDRMGKDIISPIDQKDSALPIVDFRDTNQVISLFRRGMKEFPDKFVDEIKKNMAKVGYEITEINLTSPKSVLIQSPIQNLVYFYVQEKNLEAPTEQHDMSQGMFRTLSTLINLTYGWLAGTSTCVLIDDIGEGLDFERACALINVLIEKAVSSKTQLIMSTNDRFVMNQVPLKYWTVLDRTGSRVHIFNYQNSREKFEDFNFTGLNNFDFFASEFLRDNKKVKPAGKDG